MFINVYCENFNYKKVLEWQSGQRGGKKGRERETDFPVAEISLSN